MNYAALSEIIGVVGAGLIGGALGFVAGVFWCASGDEADSYDHRE
jgi:hypothetical protein